MNDEVFFQVRYTVTVGERDDLLRDLAQLRMAESSRAEQGCLQYEYLLPVDAPDQVLLLERWSSSEAQQAHTGTAHFAKPADVKQRYGPLISTCIVTWGFAKMRHRRRGLLRPLAWGRSRIR